MAREVIFETLWTKAPGQDKLRKTAEGRVKELVRDGWHETAREKLGTDAVRIRFERDLANRPLPPLRRVPEPPPRRMDRGRRGGPGGPGGAGGRGGFGGGRGGPGGGRGGPGGPPGGARGAPGGAPGGGAPR